MDAVARLVSRCFALDFEAGCSLGESVLQNLALPLITRHTMHLGQLTGPTSVSPNAILHFTPANDEREMRWLHSAAEATISLIEQFPVSFFSTARARSASRVHSAPDQCALELSVCLCMLRWASVASEGLVRVRLVKLVSTLLTNRTCVVAEVPVFDEIKALLQRRVNDPIEEVGQLASKCLGFDWNF